MVLQVPVSPLFVRVPPPVFCDIVVAGYRRLPHAPHLGHDEDGQFADLTHILCFFTGGPQSVHRKQFALGEDNGYRAVETACDAYARAA